MVLGLRTKNKRGTTVQVDYLVHILEIEPWPSHSVRSVQSLLLQWENGVQSSGSLISTVGAGKIEFNESFRLPVTLCKASGKSKTRESFQKNCLELYLYEPLRDKMARGQLLGTATINLADYGIIKETITINAPVNFKRSFRCTVHPYLFVKIQPFEKDSPSSSLTGSLSKEASLDKDGTESISELTNDGNNEDAEIASFTDDDVSLHSSQTNTFSAVEVAGVSMPLSEENGSESDKDGTRRGSWMCAQVSGAAPMEPDLLSDLGNPMNTKCTKSFEGENWTSEYHSKVIDSGEKVQENAQQSNGDKIIGSFAPKLASFDARIQVNVNSNVASSAGSRAHRDDNEEDWSQKGKNQGEAAAVDNSHVTLLEDKKGIQPRENGQQIRILEKEDRVKTAQCNKYSPDVTQEQFGQQGHFISRDMLKHVKPVQSPFDSAKSSGSDYNNHFLEKANKIDVLELVHEDTMGLVARKETRNCFSNDNVELKSRIKMLEEELREVAAVEASLYSVVAEHGNSTSKVHAPARRLSRFYLHACRAGSQTGRASAARAAVSGIVLVSKACGNDVPRLTFWLSNSIVLRTTVSLSVGEFPVRSSTNHFGSGEGSVGRNPLKLDESFNSEEGDNLAEALDDCEDVKTFITLLEKIESWIFSRIVESVWWQTMTPHMQSAAAKTRSQGSSSKKNEGRRYGLGGHEQGNFSIELWKKAFKDACERLCPIRAGGHDCGCLPVMARLVMEQLVGRLDVAMFNAILRESVEEMPTDPVSDPISDSEVLPIPAGKSSFGAGAQLKNVIGNWSRWLTDLFDIDDDLHEHKNEIDDDKGLNYDTSFKAFHLLNALSDLMMLPLEMLSDKSVRKEVCLPFGPPLIKRILNNFVPDEFCPDPIPNAVLEAMDSEDPLEAAEECITTFPCIASPTVYSAPSTASLAGIVGDVRKSYTSDGELDELGSPLTSIFDSFRASSLPTSNWIPKGSRNIVRYQLLREVWMDGE